MNYKGKVEHIVNQLEAIIESLIEEKSKLNKQKHIAIEMLHKINNIENGAFGLKSFNTEDLKRKIIVAINQ